MQRSPLNGQPPTLSDMAPAMALSSALGGEGTFADGAASNEIWEVVQPGLRKKIARRGPWLQCFDAAGFEWNTYEMAIPHLPVELNGFRIIQLADIHARRNWQSAYDELIDRVRTDEPDLILFTGDMVDCKVDPTPALPVVRKLLNGLKARLGMLGIRGNHDLQISQDHFTDTPFQLIDGQRILVESDGPNSAAVEIVAIPGPEREHLTSEFAASVPRKTVGIPRIVMSHFPDHIRRVETMGPDVYLAGHTHGGQVCLPRGLPLLRHDSLPWQMSRGVHRLAESWFVVSRGFGFSGTPVRMFCPAEVVELQLRG